MNVSIEVANPLTSRGATTNAELLGRHKNLAAPHIEEDINASPEDAASSSAIPQTSKREGSTNTSCDL